MLPPQMRELAQRLLAYESSAGVAGEPADYAAFRVCEKLRISVSGLAGVDGFRPLFSRALSLAKAETPALSVLQIAPDGSLEGIDRIGPRINVDQAREGGITLISHLLGALTSVIGEAVTMRLVVAEVLPYLRFSSTNDVAPGFEAILNEVDQLQGVSTRLDGMADDNPVVTEGLLTIAESVRNMATILAVLVAVKSPRPN